MRYIRKILSNENLNIEDLINCLEEVKKEGNVVVVKLDGLRKDIQYTVFITFSDNHREMIRADEAVLKTALLKVLKEYEE